MKKQPRPRTLLGKASLRGGAGEAESDLFGVPECPTTRTGFVSPNAPQPLVHCRKLNNLCMHCIPECLTTCSVVQNTQQPVLHCRMPSNEWQHPEGSAALAHCAENYCALLREFLAQKKYQAP